MSFIPMWDPNKNQYRQVSEKFADQFASKGWTTDIPDDAIEMSQRARLEANRERLANREEKPVLPKVNIATPQVTTPQITAPQQTTPEPVQQPQKPTYTDSINKAYDNRANILQSGIQAQKNNVSADVERQRQALRAELANLGQRGGENITQNLNLQTAAGQRMNDIDTKYNEANMQNEADRSQALAEAFKYDQDRNDKLTQQNWQNNFQTNQFDFEKQQSAIDNAYREKALQIQTALQNRQISLQEAQAAMDNAYKEKEYQLQQNQFDFQKGQQNWENSFNQNQFDYQKGQQNWENNFQQNQFDYQKQQDSADNVFRDKQFAEDIRQFNVGQSNWQKQFTYQQMQDKIQNAYKSRQISIDQAQVALQQAKFRADQDPNSLDNQLKKAELNSANQKGTTDFTPYTTQLNKMFNDPVTGQMNNSEAIRRYVINLNLSDGDTDYLLRLYGISPN